jgi:hypothetical protein
VHVKEHNGDYLSDGSMSLRRALGIGGVNIAPEMGVFESKTMVTLCVSLGLQAELDEMLELFYESKRWVKWVNPESDCTRLHRAVIAGHYTFSTSEFRRVKERIAAAALQQGIDVDAFVVASLTTLLNRYAWNLGYFDQVSGRVR